MSLMSSSQLLDGIVLSQTQPPATETDYIDTSEGAWVCQEFVFPANYVRGSSGAQVIPDLTGVHVFAHITTDRADAVGIGYRVQRYLFGTGWITEGEGTSIIAETDGDVWLKVNFEKPIEVDENMVDDRWRICIKTRTGTTYRQPVEYDGSIAYLPGAEHAISLPEGEPTAIKVSSASGGFAALVDDFGPTLYWPLDETSGSTIEDASGSNSGTYVAPGLGVDSLLPDESGTAVQFAGSTGSYGYQNTPYDGPQIFSVGCWFQTTTTQGGTIFSFSDLGPGGGTSHDRHIWMLNSGQLYFGVWTGSAASVTSPLSYNDGLPHFAVLVFESGQGMRAYVDGELVGSNGTALPAQVYTGVWNIGYDTATSWPTNPTSQGFNGVIDEFFVLPVALETSDVADLYAAALEGSNTPAILYRESNQVYYSEQQGVDAIWLSRPNPLQTSGFVRATDYAESPIQIGGEDTSILFRLIGNVGDEGVDFLGNQYRHAVTANTADAVESSFGGESDTFWFSKPNPSRFAVETLYFDMRDDAGEAQVVDRIYVDPVTPNVYFNVYYTDEGEAGTTAQEWEEKIWTHIPKQFKMVKQENHVLPKPISTKYIAIEFSQLQPRPYAPGYFQQPIRYKKHPRWVLDYFLARTELDQLTSLGNQFVPRQIGVTYNAIDLAYNYRLDDLAQEPDAPVIINPTARNQALADVSGDKAGVVDTQALDQLRLVFNQFQRHPAFFSNVRYLLSDAVTAIVDNYPAELPDLLAQQYDVSALTQINKDSLIYEAGMPVMFFFIPCRHRYKEVSAELSHERAYFAGVRQIAFSREKYMVANDTNRYVETMGDAVNMQRTDFVRDFGGGYSVYDSNSVPATPDLVALTNRLTNPGFEDFAMGSWVGSDYNTVTRTTTAPNYRNGIAGGAITITSIAGSSYLWMDFNNTDAYIQYQPDEEISTAFWIKPPRDIEVQIGIDFYDNTKTFMEFIQGPLLSCPADEWTYVAHTFDPGPVGARWYDTGIDFGLGNLQVGDVIYVDDAYSGVRP